MLAIIVLVKSSLKTIVPNPFLRLPKNRPLPKPVSKMISKVKFYRLCDEKFERYFRNVKIFRSNAIK